MSPDAQALLVPAIVGWSVMALVVVVIAVDLARRAAPLVGLALAIAQEHDWFKTTNAAHVGVLSRAASVLATTNDPKENASD